MSILSLVGLTYLDNQLPTNSKSLLLLNFITPGVALSVNLIAYKFKTNLLRSILLLLGLTSVNPIADKFKKPYFARFNRFCLVGLIWRSYLGQPAKVKPYYTRICLISQLESQRRFLYHRNLARFGRTKFLVICSLEVR